MYTLLFQAFFASLLGHAIAAPGQRKLTPEALEKDIKTSALKRGAKQLQNIANRQAAADTRDFGSYGYNESVSYIWNQLRNTKAYDLEQQVFPSLYTKTLAESFTVSPNNETIEIASMTYTPSTPEGGITAPLVLIPDTEAAPSPGCTAGDFAGVDVTGKIALIQRGGCPFADKNRNAAAAGAVAAVVYNNVDDGIVQGTLGEPSPDYIPIGGLTIQAGQALATRLTGGENITATVEILIFEETRYSANIIATSKSGNHSNIVFLGSHLDSVPEGPGINDNGSGSITLLEIAAQLAKYKLKNAVRFGWWTAEEFGLVGSEHYVSTLPEAELAKIALYLNFDMVASPNYVLAVYDGDGSVSEAGPPGSDVIEQTFIDYFDARDLPTIPTEFDGRSDYGPFIAAGIPAGGLFTGAEDIKTEEQVALFGGTAGVAYDPNYHQAGDTYENLNFEAFTINAKAAAFVTAQFIESTDAVRNAPAPPPEPEEPVPRMAKRGANDDLKIPGVHALHVHGSSAAA